MTVAPDSIDVWATLESRTDWKQRRPRLADDIEFGAVEQARDSPYVMVANPRDLIHYQLSVPEVALLHQLDGQRTIADLVVDQLEAGGDLDLAAVVDLVAVMEVGGFLDGPRIDVDAALQRALFPPTLQRRLAAFAQTLSVSWSGAERLVAFCYQHFLRYVFSRVGLVLAGLVCVLGVAAFADVVRRGGNHLTNRHLGFAFAVLFLLDLLIIFIHELGHAAVLVHFGRRVKSAGFRIYVGTPAFFIESSDALMMKRWQRIVQSAAGPGLELVGTATASIMLWAFPSGPASLTLYQFVVINYFVLFLNLVPLLELDGYWILADALRMPHLRPDALAFVRRDFWVMLWRRERFTRGEVGLAAYGLVGIAFTIFCFVSAYYFWQRVFGSTISSLVHAGPPGWLGLAVLALLLGGPAIRALAHAAAAAGRALARRWRAVRFRWQSRWRVDAAELIDASTVFGDLPVSVLNDLAGRVSLQPLGRGQAVFRQGERADACYVVRSGSLEVTEESADGRPSRQLRTLQRGDTFGELALLEGSLRTATVRATTGTELYVVGKSAVDRLLADTARLPEFATSLQQFADLSALPAFSHLGPDDLAALADHGSWVRVGPGEQVVTEGELGDAFYVVQAGQLSVDEAGVLVRTLGPGAHFGEVALLLDVPRTATVRAVTLARLFRLDRGGFDTLLADEFRRGRLSSHAPVLRAWDH
jgi:CRP-like cAMP-binding protein/Zn-dependent protease